MVVYGHSGDDDAHKIPHKLKTHCQNQLTSLILVYFKVFYRTKYKKKCYTFLMTVYYKSTLSTLISYILNIENVTLSLLL